jgi:TetR/AcrR family transcriptional regulator, fatty acid metabolism regulator protein
MPRAKSQETRELIRKAAIEVFSEKGFYNCNTDIIAREAGVSVGTIYNYFENKDDILYYIFKIESKNIEAFFKQLNEQDITTTDKIKIFLEKYYQKVFENKKLGKVLHNESNRPARGISREILNYLLLVHSGLETLLIRGIKEKVVRPDLDPGMMASVIIGAVNSVALQGFLRPQKLKNICLKAPENIFNILSNGILGRGESFVEN